VTAAVLCRLPDVPVMVTVYVPAATEVAVLKVSVLLVVVLDALKDAVTPDGSPDAARLTVPWNPFCGLMAIALVPEAPGARFRLAGVAEIANDGGAVTVSDSLAVLLKVPEVPVIVTVDVPAAAELLAVSVSVLVVVALAGLNTAVTPTGKPAALRLTAPVKPC